MTRRATLLTAAMLGAAALAGCAPPPPAPPAVLVLSIDAGADQNLDAGGHPAAVKVYLYQLATTAKFESADFFALVEREQATLGADDLASEAVVLAPGEKRVITRELKKPTQAIGLAVGFREIDSATWRAMAPVGNTGPQKMTLTIKGKTATLAQTPGP